MKSCTVELNFHEMYLIGEALQALSDTMFINPARTPLENSICLMYQHNIYELSEKLVSIVSCFEDDDKEEAE